MDSTEVLLLVRPVCAWCPKATKYAIRYPAPGGNLMLKMQIRAGVGFDGPPCTYQNFRRGTQLDVQARQTSAWRTRTLNSVTAQQVH